MVELKNEQVEEFGKRVTVMAHNAGCKVNYFVIDLLFPKIDLKLYWCCEADILTF